MSAKKQQDDEYEFEMPEFDEDEFIAGEKRKAKTYFISFGFGIVMAIVCHLAWRSIDAGLRWGLTFVLAVCAIGFLVKLLQLLGIDISEFGKKEWFGSIAFYFFTWLAIFILSVNPPFYDASGPEIESTVLPSVQQAGDGVFITARVTDNTDVSEVRLTVSRGDTTIMRVMDNPIEAVYAYMFPDAANETEKDFAGEEGVYHYRINATDGAGHTRAGKNGTFSFTGQLLYIDAPDDGSSIDASTDIQIRLDKNVLAGFDDDDRRDRIRVYYVVNNDTEVNATFYDSFGGEYVYNTSAVYQGWQPGQQNTLRLHAEVQDYYVLPEDIDYGWNLSHRTVSADQTYTYNVEEDSSVGVKASPSKEWPDRPDLQRVPGFGILAAVGALAAVLLVLRRRRERLG
ncbi:MAG: hypothetical protein KGY55_04335 [Candidatus Thermoplasmatota archaeon]|nr:hypothetical protein [Candidatus Thermoplasmatota archaeon]